MMPNRKEKNELGREQDVKETQNEILYFVVFLKRRIEHINIKVTQETHNRIGETNDFFIFAF